MEKTDDKAFAPGEPREAKKEVRRYLDSPQGQGYYRCTVCHAHLVWQGLICIDCLEMGKSIS